MARSIVTGSTCPAAGHACVSGKAAASMIALAAIAGAEVEAELAQADADHPREHQPVGGDQGDHLEAATATQTAISPYGAAIKTAAASTPAGRG